MSASTGARILLGIDYGTTYTGLAWLQFDGQTTPSLSDINVYKSWPGEEAQKVPSAFSYSHTSSANYRQWGFSIDNESEVLRWTKLDLEPRKPGKELEVVKDLMKGLDMIKRLRQGDDAGVRNGIPRHISKSSEDVVRDYLTKVAREWYQHMRGLGIYTLDTVPLDIIFTHPADWSYEALNKTFRAIVGAFPRSKFKSLENIYTTSEPEACALYTVQDLLAKNHNSFFPGECFVLCDAGGGTVDLVTYYIDSVEPLQLTKVGSPAGGRYGSVFIDQAFLAWLEVRLENLDLHSREFGTGGHITLMPKGRVLLDRFEKDKHAFTGLEEANITLPRGIKVAPEFQDDLGSGVVKLTANDLRGMFQKSVKGTVTLIMQQIAHVESIRHDGNPCQVTNIFLAGGFAENRYLFNEVERYAKTRGETIVHKAEECWSGVVRGALLRGMGIGAERPPALTSCERHYGICVNQQYRDWVHTGENAVRDALDGELKVHSQLCWLIRKGDLISSKKGLKADYECQYQVTREQFDAGKTLHMTFVATADIDPPSALADLSAKNEVYSLAIDLKEIPKDVAAKHKCQAAKGYYYTFNVRVEIRVSSKVTVTVFLCHDERKLVEYQTKL